MACLDDLTITNLVGNALPELERVVALAHLDDCRTCSELVAAMAIGSPRPHAERERLAPGTAVGRYVVERVAGAGAMGVVYAARDPKLDRTVALKLMAAADGARTHDRMLREAKAMAQLSHRNVVSIFDVGTYGDDIFLAMEFLPGRTLRQWLAEQPRVPREIVAALADAGRGLDAAHAAGVIHRDVKPDNILMSDDGRVCVTDFGLARASDMTDAEAPPDDARVDVLTATGHVLGTPVYMAPEQLAGSAADVRSDQFSFCVVAYECLAGQRPFAARTLAELREAHARAPAPIARVPAWIQRVIVRGLAPDPRERFASMTALLDALARDPALRYRQVAVAGGAVVLAAVAALAIMRRDKDTCPSPRDRLTGTWDAARRTHLDGAFHAQWRPYTAAVLAHVTAGFDRYADRWVALRRDACRATYDRRDQSEARYDVELACFERRRGELAAAVDVLANAPDEQTVRNAVSVVQGLADLQPCRNGEALSTQAPLPAHPATRMQVDVGFRTLASARTLAKTAKYTAAQALVDDLLPRVRVLGYAPLLAELLYLHGKLQMATRDAAVAKLALDEAATLAATAKDDTLAARVWIQQVYTAGVLAHDAAAAASLDRVARTAVQRAGDPAELVIDWHDAVGAVLVEQAKYDEALPHFREALVLAEPATSPAHDRLSDQLSKLASVLDVAGQYAEARTVGERAIPLIEAQLGPDHPDLAFALDALGGIYYDGGDYATAQRQYRRALAILDKLGEPATYNTTEAIEGLGNTALALGQLDEARKQHERALAIRERTAPDDPHVADSLINLGMVLVAQGDVAGARKHYDRALALYREVLGPDHPQVAVALRHRAQVAMGTQQAIDDLEAALALTVAALGADHPEVGVQHGNLGAAYAGMKRWKQAQEHYALAVANHEKTVGATHEMTAMALTGLGQAMIEQHDSAGAIAVLERALAIHDANHALAAMKAVPRWFFVRALWESGRDRPRARALATQARDELADARDPTSVEVRSELARWLAKH